MSDLLRKGFHLGLGAAISGKERFEKLLDDAVKEGEVSPSQAREMANNFIQKGEKQDREWTEQSRAKMQDHIRELGFVTKEEYEILEARVQRLESYHEKPEE
ncbi:phasin family protein [Thalassobacillus sp. CUG 92003]|uniref:phasin family protein n=1 Tax=Thalassobacillus sp. CUG 92003 TaxID=2736641 RepID=UPI0015E641C5|nr:hypothetical protein [Thalassobacillus sp. CUG 92003]